MWEKARRSTRTIPLPTDALSITKRSGILFRKYVKGNCHTNGAESFWSMLKRSYHGTFHHFSEQHTDRYVGEFAARYNLRELDTLDQMAVVASRLEGKRLRYKDLVG